MNKILLLSSVLIFTLGEFQPLWSMNDDVKEYAPSVKRKIAKGCVQTKGGELFYRDSGGTGPVVLCIHGNSTDNWLFKRLMSENTEMRFISFSSPGHGKSFKASDQLAEGIYSFLGNAKIFLEALDQDELRIKEFSILGVSKGGHEAINLYALAPERVKSMILSGTPPFRIFLKMDLREKS
ncbi:MAG: alpha/beta hydrolase [Alphaproteobacteria bacterium]|nr:alpha/beta hydrolase [Alphaproteobacteria bacterium]